MKLKRKAFKTPYTELQLTRMKALGYGCGFLQQLLTDRTCHASCKSLPSHFHDLVRHLSSLHNTQAQVSTRVNQMHASRTQAKRQIPPFSSFPAPGIHRFLITLFPENAFVGRKTKPQIHENTEMEKEELFLLFFLTWMDDTLI